MEFKIEKNIPIKSALSIYPFEKMEIGDSFFMPIKKGLDPKNQQCKLHSCASSFAKTRKLPWKFRTSKLKTGIRIWRSE